MLEPWRLTYPGTDIPFGPTATGLPISAAPEYGPTDLSVDDQNGARSDGVILGQDFRHGTTITFELHAIGATRDEAAALATAFMTAWRGDAIRSTPGAVAELRAPSGRSALGRPRRAALDETLARHGKYAITVDFVTIDDVWYGDVESIEVPIALSQSGGLVGPLKSPLVSRGSSTRQNAFVVGGTLPTWPTITMNGSILNPVVAVAGRFQYAAATSLKYDENIRIDSRRGTVLRNGSQLAALTRSSDLIEDALLDPGAYTLTLSGSSTTGNPTAEIAWRSAFPTP